MFRTKKKYKKKGELVALNLVLQRRGRGHKNAKFATSGTTSIFCKSVQKITTQFDHQMVPLVLFAWIHNPFYHNYVTEQYLGIADLDVW